MQASGREIREFCRKIENELNQCLFSQTNSSHFVDSAAKMMESHLDRLTEFRTLGSQWLDAIGLPERDEIAAIAVTWIRIESRLDHMDDILYQMHKDIRCYREQMAGLTKEISYL